MADGPLGRFSARSTGGAGLHLDEYESFKLIYMILAESLACLSPFQKTYT